MNTKLELRHADRSDRDRLRTMQAISFRQLARPYYDDETIEAFISGVGTMDDTLLDDGTYLAAWSAGEIVGCGGWSWRPPGYAAHIAPGSAAGRASKATVRSVFVHPQFARQGIARRLMARIEAEIAAARFNRASLTATLSGIALYRHLGYRSADPVTLRLRDGLTFVGLGMEKSLS